MKLLCIFIFSPWRRRARLAAFWGLRLWVVTGCEERVPTARPSLSPPAATRVVRQLALERALPVDGPSRFQPSGLLFRSGRLYTVSDKHDRQLYELLFERDRVRAVVARRFRPPRGSGLRLDWEGLAPGSDGAVLLLSESRHRVLQLQLEGPQAAAHWVTPSLRPLARRVGCLSRLNAGLEGLARLPNGALLLAAEREPRGLLEWPAAPASGEHQGRAWAWPLAAPALDERGPDVGDLATSETGSVYALLRGEHRVARLMPHLGGYREGDAWSYAETENELRYQYQDMRYGRAEGLAVAPERVFVVLDNNGDARRLDATDRRPLLFVFSRPSRLF